MVFGLSGGGMLIGIIAKILCGPCLWGYLVAMVVAFFVKLFS
jgi:hypothetical protein